MADNRFKDFPYDARFPSPGVDVRFDTPGLDRRFMDGQDTRFEGSDYGGIPVIGGVPSLAGVNFTRGVVRTWGGLDFSLTRSSDGTVVDAAGNIVSVPPNTPRLQSVGGGKTKLIMELGRTNFLLNSATVAAQNITVTAQSYALSFYGTGSINLSGAHSATLVGTGATNRVSLVFTPTAGTLTVTPSGDVRLGQVEAGPVATAYIATAGSAVARSSDISNSNLSAALQSAMAGGYWAVIKGLEWFGSNANFDRAFQFDKSDADRCFVSRDTSNNTYGATQQVSAATPPTQASQNRAWPTLDSANIAVRFAPNNFSAVWPDGVINTDAVALFVGPNVLRIASRDPSGNGKPVLIRMSQIDIFPPSISDADMNTYRGIAP